MLGSQHTVQQSSPLSTHFLILDTPVNRKKWAIQLKIAYNDITRVILHNFDLESWINDKIKIPAI
jgi:hypothetical protein